MCIAYSAVPRITPHPGRMLPRAPRQFACQRVRGNWGRARQRKAWECISKEKLGAREAWQISRNLFRVTVSTFPATSRRFYRHARVQTIPQPPGLFINASFASAFEISMQSGKLFRGDVESAWSAARTPRRGLLGRAINGRHRSPSSRALSKEINRRFE